MRNPPIQNFRNSLFSGLLLVFALSCAVPPARPLIEESRDANPNADQTQRETDPEESTDEGVEGGNPSDQDEVSGKDPMMEPSAPKAPGNMTEPSIPKVPGDMMEPKVPIPPKVPDVTKPADPSPIKEPKFSLLFIGGGSNQISIYNFDKKLGVAKLLKNNAIDGRSATFLAVHPASRSVFAVLMMSLDPATGTLTSRGKERTENGPTHLAVDSTGKSVIVANYGAGSVQSFSVNGNALVAKSTKKAGGNAHAAQIGPDGKNVFVPCKGSNHIAQYSLSADGALTESSPAIVKAGNEPRHMVFHPKGKHAFLMNEKEGSVQPLSYNGSILSLNGGQVASTMAPVQGNTGAEIQVHPNGKFLYSSNRGDDSIAIYAIAETGTVTLQKTVKTGGQVPRHFALDPSGSWITVANQNSNSVTLFEVDKVTGGLTPKGASISFPNAPQYAEIFDFYE